LRTKIFAPTPQLFRILKIVNQIKPNIIQIHDPSYLGKIALITSIQQNIPIVANHHFTPAFITSYFNNILKSEKITKKLEGQIWKSIIKLYNQLDHIIVPSQTFKTVLTHHPIYTSISVISPGVDLNTFTPAKTKPYPYLIYFGRLDKDKNLDNLLKAYALSNQRYRLVIAGSGKQKLSLKTLAKKLKINQSCQFTDFIPNNHLPSLYQNAYAYIITSKVETFSLTTLQAAASGLPIIAADAGALPELVNHHKNGLLVSPDNIKSISQAINYLFSHPQIARKLGHQSRQLAQRHCKNKTFKQYSSLFHQLTKT